MSWNCEICGAGNGEEHDKEAHTKYRIDDIEETLEQLSKRIDNIEKTLKEIIQTIGGIKNE